MNVWPTNSGMSVQALAQVVIGSLIPCWFSLSTLPYSFASTYGPFLSERPICQLSALLLRDQFLYAVSSAATPANNCFVGCLATIARHAAFGAFARWAHRMTTTLGATFTTTVRMIDRVHRRTAVMWTTAQPTATTGLAPHDRVAIGIACSTNRGSAGRGDAP